MQQYLPFTVLKLADGMFNDVTTSKVATVPTVYGIETLNPNTMVHFFLDHRELQQYLPFTVLKLCASITFNPPLRCNSTYRLRY